MLHRLYTHAQASRFPAPCPPTLCKQTPHPFFPRHPHPYTHQIMTTPSSLHPLPSPMHTHRTTTPHASLQQRRMPYLTADAVIAPPASFSTSDCGIVVEGWERGKRGGSCWGGFSRGGEGVGVGIGGIGVGEEAGEVEGMRAREGEEGGFLCSNQILRNRTRKENLPSSTNASPHPQQHPGFTASGRFLTPSSPFPPCRVPGFA